MPLHLIPSKSIPYKKQFLLSLIVLNHITINMLARTGALLTKVQLFLKIAFGDFLGATMTECTLLTPKKDSKIRTGCMWTLKRDVFGTPMMIIGNFLPIV